MSLLGHGSGIAYLALAAGQGDVDETAGVRESLLRTALTIRLSIRDFVDATMWGGDIRSLLLLLLLDLGGLRLDLSCSLCQILFIVERSRRRKWRQRVCLVVRRMGTYRHEPN